MDNFDLRMTAKEQLERMEWEDEQIAPLVQPKSFSVGDEVITTTVLYGQVRIPENTIGDVVLYDSSADMYLIGFGLDHELVWCWPRELRLLDTEERH